MLELPNHTYDSIGQTKKVFTDTHVPSVKTNHLEESSMFVKIPTTKYRAVLIEMKAKILYLANQWMDFKMLLMSNRFLCRFGGVLISGISRNFTIFGTILINLSTFMHFSS